MLIYRTARSLIGCNIKKEVLIALGAHLFRSNKQIQAPLNDLNQIGLVEETNDLSTHMLALSLLVVHDSHRSGQHNMSELTARKEVASPHLNLVHLDIEAGGDATALVQTTVQIHNHLSRTVIINDGDFTNVSYSSIFLPIAHPSSACTEGTSEAPSSKDEREPDAYHASQRW